MNEFIRPAPAAYCKWCGEPLELTDNKLYPWQHINPETECTKTEPARDREFIPFVAVQKSIMQGRRWIAAACSTTMAKRIARALNKHIPNEKGV